MLTLEDETRRRRGILRQWISTDSKRERFSDKHSLSAIFLKTKR